MARAKKSTAKKTTKTKATAKTAAPPARMNRQAASRAKTDAKTIAKQNKAKPAKPAKPAKKPAARKPAAKKRAATESLVEDDIVIGSVTAPSGRLAIFDVGLVGYLPRAALEPAMIVASVPADRPLPLVGRRLGEGRFAKCWDCIAIALGDGEVASSTKLGEAGVDFARLIAIDHEALDHWRHEDSLDGLADFVFWGRDAGHLARAVLAPAAPEGHGWANLPLAEAEARADQAGRLKAKNHWLLATDFRPHSHHFHALAAARQDPHGVGAIDVAGARAALFSTSWGDGVFPIYLDADAAGRPVQLRVQLATPESVSAMLAVNG